MEAEELKVQEIIESNIRVNKEVYRSDINLATMIRADLELKGFLNYKSLQQNKELEDRNTALHLKSIQQIQSLTAELEAKEKEIEILSGNLIERNNQVMELKILITDKNVDITLLTHALTQSGETVKRLREWIAQEEKISLDLKDAGGYTMLALLKDKLQLLTATDTEGKGE